jgi:hypothetical protein
MKSRTLAFLTLASAIALNVAAAQQGKPATVAQKPTSTKAAAKAASTDSSKDSTKKTTSKKGKKKGKKSTTGADSTKKAGTAAKKPGA